MTNMGEELDTRVALEEYTIVAEETGTEFGRGAYAAVVEVDYLGLRCAGKKIHSLLVGNETGTLVNRFGEECKLLSRLRHPHIVQFIGVYFERRPGPTAPVLVMEYLPTTLAEHLDRNFQFSTFDQSISILNDVALGLRYLHEQRPPIIHRDLSANNVLLTSNLRAKISDLGMAKILNLTPLQLSKMTQVPGTPAYMPPEALVAEPKYTTTIDIFSYGVLITHILCGRWPIPTREAVCIETARGVTEAERREVYLDEIGRDRGHCLMPLILQCLDNKPDSRPKASEIQVRIKRVMRMTPYRDNSNTSIGSWETHSDSVTDHDLRSEHFDIRQVEVEANIEHLKNMVDAKDKEMNAIKERLQAKHQAECCEKDADIALLKKKKQMEISALEQQKQMEISALEQQKQMEISALEQQYSSKLGAKQKEIAALESSYEQTIATKESLLESKDDVIEKYGSTIQALNDQISQLLSSPTTSQPHLFNLHAKLVWTNTCTPLPSSTTGAQSVLINGKVYVGGGDAGSNDYDYIVSRYDPIRDVWGNLPPCPVKQFGMGNLCDKLVLAGGISHDGTVVSDLYTYDEHSQNWEMSMPAMPTARHSLTVIGHQMSLIAIGGAASPKGNLLDVVEVYTNGRWEVGEPIGHPCSSMLYTVYENTCFLMGGFRSTGISGNTKSVFYADMRTLVQKGSLPSSRFHAPPTRSSSSSSIASQSSLSSIWRMLPDSPYYHSTPALLAGCLLAIGGSTQTIRSKFHKSIHAYCPCSEKWVHVGDLPAARAQCTVIVLPSSELLVIGGRESTVEARSNVVSKAYIQV